MRLLILSLLTTLVLFSCEKKIEDPLKSLQEEGIHTLNINLYPSNIKMINANNNPEFAEATKGIKKLHILQIQLKSDSNEMKFQEWKSNQDFTGWESIFTARIEGSDIEVKTPKDREDILFATAETKEGIFVGFLEGAFDISKLPQLMKSDLNFGPIGDFIQDKDKREKQREKARKIREAYKDEIDEEVEKNTTTEE